MSSNANKSKWLPKPSDQKKEENEPKKQNVEVQPPATEPTKQNAPAVVAQPPESAADGKEDVSSKEKEEKVDSQQRLKDLEEKRAFRRANLEVKRPTPASMKSLDSSIKKNTAFIKVLADVTCCMNVRTMYHPPRHDTSITTTRTHTMHAHRICTSTYALTLTCTSHPCRN